MHRVFQAFIDRLSESSDDEALRDAMAGAAASLDLSCFAYLWELSP
jgi:LuxR family transcriptional activator of conjugal transfer of Ti plasmids